MRILNSISLNMLDSKCRGFEIVDELVNVNSDCAYNEDGWDVVNWSFTQSCIGHKQLVDVVNKRYNLSLTTNRETVKLSKGEKALIIQYKGPRLKEGETSISDDSDLKFLIVQAI